MTLTPSKNCHTERDMVNKFAIAEEDLVKISVKGDSPPHELDMAPYF